MYRLAALTLGIFALYGSNALAQDYEKADRRFYIAPQGAYFVGDSHRELDDQFGYGISLGKILGRGPNLELNYEVFEPDAESGENGPVLESYGVSLLMFPMRKQMPFYLLAKVGRGLTTYTVDGKDQDIESDQLDLGLGYMLGLGDWPVFGNGPALRLEARYRYDKYSSGQAAEYAALSGIEAERAYHDYIVGIGLQIPLGPDPNASVPLDEREPDEIIIIKALDSDGDQIPDSMDDCPNTPAGANVDVRGCERDSDGDGVADSADRCPNTAAGLSVDVQGCAADSDGDGILNVNDQCPTTPRGAAVLADGCAPTGDCRLPKPGQSVDGRGCVAEDAIILKGVNFDSGLATLTGDAENQLDEVAKVLAGSRGVVFEVGGHTDSSGDPEDNRVLSEQRAIAVKKYLVSRGVPAGILTARGYGASQPLVSNETATNRARNRRVELRAISR